MEIALKLKKDHYENEEDEIRCICGILQSIARITFTHGELFNAYEYLYTGQTTGIDSNGKVNFVEFIGVTDKELVAIQHKELTIKELFEKLNTDVTSYTRPSIV